MADRPWVLLSGSVIYPKPPRHSDRQQVNHANHAKQDTLLRLTSLDRIGVLVIMRSVGFLDAICLHELLTGS